MEKDYKKIQLLVIDVDGTLTDSGLYYGQSGEELKKFSTKDAAGFFAASTVGIKTMILTGRESKTVQRRMEELKADYIIQGIRNKRAFLEDFMKKNKLIKSNVGYIGDDLNDYGPMQLAGFIGCPWDACEEIISITDCRSKCCGGEGAVRDIIFQLLKSRGELQYAINEVYGAGI